MFTSKKELHKDDACESSQAAVILEGRVETDPPAPNTEDDRIQFKVEKAHLRPDADGVCNRL